jgi:hypothetical protein
VGERASDKAGTRDDLVSQAQDEALKSYNPIDGPDYRNVVALERSRVIHA